MRRFTPLLAFFIILLVLASIASAGQDKYPFVTPEKIKGELDRIVKASGGQAKILELASTPGNRSLYLLEIGQKGSDKPAIMVVANMEGNSPTATEAALKLANNLVGDWKSETDNRLWYIVPLGNPDGYARYFVNPLSAVSVNDKLFNDDNDDATDEDGPDDLNGDGFITKIRQIHPEGKMIVVDDNPLLMKKADAGKGEVGKYRLFPEGIDNDGDGEINEDGFGGVNPGLNFPHNFNHFTKTGGRWAASEVESRAIMRFTYDHPEIAMAITFGRANTLKSVPESSRKSQASQSTYKLPSWMARQAGVDEDTKLPLSEIVVLGRELFDSPDLTEEQVLQYLDAGAAVNPSKKDLPYWEEISEKYNEFIKDAGMEEKRLDPKSPSDGSFEEWAYYHFGVPSFAVDFWTLPEPKEEEKDEDGALTPDDVEKMSNDEFIALGEEKISAFLKSSGAPDQYTAAMVIKGLEGGMMDTKKMAKMLKKSKKKEDAGGADETEEALFAFNPDAFVAWQPFDHPTLGKVEIGGMIPYSTVTPPADAVDSLIGAQLPFLKDLTGMLPKIVIDRVDVEKLSSDVWKVEAWVVNKGFLPYPTHQGQRCQRPSPAVATVSGKSLTILDGKKRTVLKLLEGSGGYDKAVWMIRAPQGTKITIDSHSFSAGVDRREVTLEGGSR